jgi:hypothetical protein
MEASSKVRLTGPSMRLQSGEGPGLAKEPGFGAKVGVVLTMLIGALFFVGALIVVTAVALVAVLVALCVVGIRGALHALVPHSGDHRVAQGGFRPSSVIDTTARVIRSTAPKPRP